MILLWGTSRAVGHSAQEHRWPFAAPRRRRPVPAPRRPRSVAAAAGVRMGMRGGAGGRYGHVLRGVVWRAVSTGT
jgi:hypothetical protein